MEERLNGLFQTEGHVLDSLVVQVVVVILNNAKLLLQIALRSQA